MRWFGCHGKYRRRLSGLMTADLLFMPEYIKFLCMLLDMALDDDERIQDAISSLKTMIKTPVEDSELRARLDTYLNKYLMDIESSKRAIVKEYGGSDRNYIPPDDPDTPLSERSFKRGSYMTFVAKVVKKTTDYFRNSGKTKYVTWVEDNSDTAKIISWDGELDVETGKVYRFKSWKVEYNDYEKDNTISPGNNGGFVETGEYDIQSGAYRRNIKFAVGFDELEDGMSNIVVAGRVRSIRLRQSGGRGPAIKGVMDIDGGAIEFISWDEGLDLNEGDDVCINRVKVKYDSFIHNIELVFSNASEIARRD